MSARTDIISTTCLALAILASSAAGLYPPSALAAPMTDSCTLQYPGDVNGDGFINGDDACYLNDFLRYGGPAPAPLSNGDPNGDCLINCDDISFLIAHTFYHNNRPVDCTCQNPTVEGCAVDTCPNRPAGDFNGDGSVNLGDVILLQSYLNTGVMTRPPQYYDVDGDCHIDFGDVTCITGPWVGDPCVKVTCGCLIPTSIIADTCGAVHPGDADGDGFITDADLIFLTSFLCGGGPAPQPIANGDANGDCRVDTADVRYLDDHLNRGGPPAVDCTCQNPIIGPCNDDCDGYTPGDANASYSMNVADAVYIIGYVFKSGPAPTPFALFSGDTNCDGAVNIGDGVFVINYVFRSGPAPCSCLTWLTLHGLLR